jgi:phospholipid-binding lipoprotein MlaA
VPALRRERVRLGVVTRSSIEIHFRARRSMAFALLSTTLAACATARDPRDPLEPMNRGVYEFNEALDKTVLKPAAKGYKAAVPSPLRAGITNLFGNFADVAMAINGVLQGNLSTAASDVGRIAINSTVGFFGVFDVASRLGLEKDRKDFGQTLGVRAAVPACRHL